MELGTFLSYSDKQQYLETFLHIVKASRTKNDFLKNIQDFDQKYSQYHLLDSPIPINDQHSKTKPPMKASSQSSKSNLLKKSKILSSTKMKSNF